MAESPIDAYLRTIRREVAAGDATEHTHRLALQTLIQSFAPGVTVINEPKRIDCGAPDLGIRRNKVPLGHIETKDIGANLDEMERGKGPHGEQFVRYRDGLPNWVLTDYLDFRWFVAGEKRLTTQIASVDGKGKLRPIPGGDDQLAQLLDAFLRQEALTVGTAKELAQRMAGMARILRDLIVGAFTYEAEKGWLHNWLAAFREVLIPDLDEKQFADMFAQTLAYGLFAARVHAGSGRPFSRELAAFSLPKTNPFLRKLFSEIAGVDMPETIDWAVDGIVELLKHTAMEEILKDFGKGKGKEDPVVHFYETFLAAYDPKVRELRGVYYTPEPVVSYIVRSVDYLLKTRFNRFKGLADENTLILDPATGTATFLYFVIRQVYEKFISQPGAWDSYVGSHLLNRVFGFELLMAPYAVAHLKLGMELQETGYTFGSDQRLGIYMTNTLEEAAARSEKLFAQWISDEANEASDIKSEKPILVVLGNPPYSGHSANRSEVTRQLRPGDSYKVISGGPLRQNKVTKIFTAKKSKTVREKTFIGDLIDDYKVIDGSPLRERNPKWLQDDYVKFIRWGQWRIERTGAGVLAFITNNGYLDNLTFRGMRQSLMNAFTDIYVLDLHGNSKKKEKSPDGSPDENVFDIQQGVTLGIFIKERDKTGPAKVHHSVLWGLRKSKYQALFETDVVNTVWEELSPQAPPYLFIPRQKGLEAEYEGGWSVTDAMPANSLGIATARDSLAVRWSGPEMMSVARDFATLPVEEARAKYDLGQDARDWKVSLAQEDLRSRHIRSSDIKEILYRPFDSRFTYYTGRTRGFHCMPRREVMGHLLSGKNLGLCTTRSVEIARGWEHVFCSQNIIQLHTVSLKEVNYLFPLHLYDSDSREAGQGNLSELDGTFNGRRPNFCPKFIVDLENRLGLKFVSDGTGDLKKTFGPEDVFNYIYAIFHSPTYRTRYAEFLKSDFPRVPLTSDVNLFRSLCGLGAELVALHLLESSVLEMPIAQRPGKGSNIIEKGFPKYIAPGEPEPGTGKPLERGRVYINKDVGAAVNDLRPPLSPLLNNEEGKREARGGCAEEQGQYFEGVPPEVWNFHIGGYQVCEKWLKDRRGRKLTYDDQEHYCKVVTAIHETIRLMAEIDAAIPKWPLS